MEIESTSSDQKKKKIKEDSNGNENSRKSKKRRVEQANDKENISPASKEGEDNNSNKHNLSIYGNYPRYYGYRRHDTSGQQDPRVPLIRIEWLKGKTCLDIGCNTGKFTLALAKRCDPVSITGMDIDEKLIAEANQWLQKKKDKAKLLARMPKSFVMTYGPLKQKETLYPNNASFIVGNYLEWKSDSKFDCILCMSTTKWIHLNWGDEGIKKLFKKVYDQLNDGGMFFLEPQEWKSYKKKASLTPTIKQNYANIKFKPDQFIDYLTKELGFTLLRKLDVKSNHIQKGFQRPIFVFEKKN